VVVDGDLLSPQLANKTIASIPAESSQTGQNSRKSTSGGRCWPAA
jgi:hypothetical protein